MPAVQAYIQWWYCWDVVPAGLLLAIYLCSAEEGHFAEGRRDISRAELEYQLDYIHCYVSTPTVQD